MLLLKLSNEHQTKIEVMKEKGMIENMHRNIFCSDKHICFHLNLIFIFMYEIHSSIHQKRNFEETTPISYLSILLSSVLGVISHANKFDSTFY